EGKLALAQPHGAFGDGIEYRLQVGRRSRDDAQHLGRRSLLLQRLGELLFQVGVGCASAANVSSRLRCLRTKTGNACSALCPFASQGHLVGTVTRLSILTEPHDELAAPDHSITSSARASSVGGMVRSSAFAVLMLMLVTSFVENSTGRSAGLLPLRILSTKSAAPRLFSASSTT